MAAKTYGQNERELLDELRGIPHRHDESCLGHAQIVDYALTGAEDYEDLENIEQHMGSCEQCQLLVSFLETILSEELFPVNNYECVRQKAFDILNAKMN